MEDSRKIECTEVREKGKHINGFLGRTEARETALRIARKKEGAS
jgi:hypothetical protein